MAKHLFISKSFSELEELPAFLNEQKIELIAQSFLHFEMVPFQIENSYDIIFFSSPRSFLFFTRLKSIPKEVKIACTGNKTAELISKLGYKVDFVGDHSGSIEQVATEFKQWCGKNRVLFPTSSISLKSIAKQLDPNQCEIITVYETTIVSKPLAFCDTYVFTSPSNVKGFLELNQLPDSAEVISWGQSTTACLESFGLQATYTLTNSSIQDLIDYLK